MKRTFFIVLALCIALLLAACSTSAVQASSAAPASSAAATASAAAQPSESAAASPSASASESASASATASAAATIVANPDGLTIAAAASLKDAMAEIATAYQTVAPDVSLTITYGASGSLQTQIEQGAPVDIFMSAGAKQMDALEEGNLLLEGTRANLLSNKLVLIVPADSDKAISSFEDLATDRVDLVALGDPKSVPAGQYAEQVLTSLNILDKVKAKTNYGTDVRQVLTWVESGDVDCGVVYATDAATSDKVTVVCEAPADVAPKINYPVAVIASSKQATAAQDFLNYLKTSDAAAIFEKYSFTMAK